MLGLPKNTRDAAVKPVPLTVRMGGLASDAMSDTDDGAIPVIVGCGFVGTEDWTAMVTAPVENSSLESPFTAISTGPFGPLGVSGGTTAFTCMTPATRSGAAPA